MDQKWITAGEATKLLGYGDVGNISRLVRRGEKRGVIVETKPHPRNATHFLYSREGLLKVFESLNHKHSHAPEEQWSWIEFKNFMKIEPPAIVVGDAHCPLVDMEFFYEVLRVRDKLKIDKLVLAGDTLDCSAQSKFSDLFPIPWPDEKRVARGFIERCCKEFDSVHMLTANHEMRYLRMLGPKTTIDKDVMIADRGKELDVREVILSKWRKIELQGRLHISIYPYCEVGETWRISHPTQAWKNPTGLARTLQQIHNKSIMMGHTHMSAWCMAPDGEHLLIDLGCFSNPIHFSWVNLKEQSRFKWTESFGVIHEDEWGSLIMKGRGEVAKR